MLWLSNQYFLSKKNDGFTIVELMTVIVVMVILATIVIVGYGAWEKNLASDLVKNDLRAAGAEMEKSRNWEESTSGGYPSGLPGDFSPSAGVNVSGGGRAGGGTYCFTGTSTSDTSINFYVSNKQKEPTPGNCSFTLTTVIPGNTQVDMWGSPQSITRAGGIVFGDDGLLYTTQNNAILQQNLSSGVVVAFSGTGVDGSTDGAANIATWRGPNDIVKDRNGDYYVTAVNNSSVRKVSKTDGSTSYYSGTNGRPVTLEIDNRGNLYVGTMDCNSNPAIRKITAAGVFTGYAGNGSCGNADGDALTTARFQSIVDLTMDSQGNLYVADTGNCHLRRVTPFGQVETVAGNGSCGTNDGSALSVPLQVPGALVVDEFDNVWMSSDNHLKVYTHDGYIQTYRTSANGQLAWGAMNLEFDDEGNIWYTDLNNRTQKITIP